ncbi:uncharacterized protein B0H18DRAFT_875173 [Fomitopsis serialis]|uniref:uncharacterized protein n=1 Tax=Fomitopsis serialis TaxID=139415 RepID=UPI002008481B|nr:uncharacterized protein B0H18DRAFT_875173 [Neoantrodia serialis]KAH9928117.1 hypothetical protein B0H18DRAFT_875173 [Neoantrodia serialis]
MQAAQADPATAVTLERIAREIDMRLLRASQDDLGLRDFASYAAGARPINELTSLTYDTRGIAEILFASTFASGERRPSPSTVLKRNLLPGSCWPMVGSSGYIGIRLSDPVRIRNVTIDHLPSSLDRESRTAPRSVLVWAILPVSASVKTNAATQVKRTFPIPSAIPTGFEAVPIAELEYDVLKPQHIQTFPVDDAVHSLKIEEVVFQVLTNWGSPDSTCLYRVRVHGESDGKEENA